MKETRAWPERGIHEKYLLGLLSEEETVELERRYFADDEIFERLAATETDLLDEYARGELSDSERSAFERRSMDFPSLRGRLETATALRQGLAGRPVPSLARGSRPVKWVAPVVAAAALLLAVLGLRLALETVRLRRGLESAITEQNRLQAETRNLKENLAAGQAKAGRKPEAGEGNERAGASGNTTGISPLSAGRTVAFTLVAELLRDVPGSNDFVAPSDAGAVLLEVPVSSEKGWLYRIWIETPSGRQVLDQQDLRALPRTKGSAAVIAATRESLPAGDYVLRLARRRSHSAFEDAGDFAFHLAYR